MRRLLALALLAVSAGSANAQSIPNTGEFTYTDGPGHHRDLNWNVSCAPGALLGVCTSPLTIDAYVVESPPGAWVGAFPDTKWIGYTPSASIPGNPGDGGDRFRYFYSVDFSLGSIDPLFAQLVMDFRIDNLFIGWSLNGSAYSTAGVVGSGFFGSPTPATMTISSGFTSGTNTLTMQVQGDGVTDGFVARSAVLSEVPAVAPEPATIVLLGSGLGALGLGAMRRRPSRR